ncbi:MAG: hypothetical protein HC822_02635 [Oscillochloris sp.]|nr:hypothetical protein [Oscillochloris sp.]
MSVNPRSARRRQPVRSSQRRQPARVIAPPDYTREYMYVRRDLMLIALIGGLLLAGMIAASFVI